MHECMYAGICVRINREWHKHTCIDVGIAVDLDVTYVYRYKQIYTHRDVHVCTCLRRDIYTSTYADRYACACTYTHAHARTDIHMYVYVYMHMRIIYLVAHPYATDTHMHMFVHMHTCSQTWEPGS